MLTDSTLHGEFGRVEHAATHTCLELDAQPTEASAGLHARMRARVCLPNDTLLALMKAWDTAPIYLQLRACTLFKNNSQTFALGQSGHLATLSHQACVAACPLRPPA